MEEIKDLVVEETEELATCSSRNGLIIAAGAVGLLIAGGLTYNYVIKPLVAKIRAKKETAVIEADFATNEDEDIEA